MKRYIFIMFMFFISSCAAFAQGRFVHNGDTGKIILHIFPEARDGILFFASENQEFQWWFDGRVYLDGAYYFDKQVPMNNGTEIRKARFALKTTLWNHWATEFDLDFADEDLDIKDMWIGYFFTPRHYLKAGNFKEPFGIENSTSSRYIKFMERAYASNLFPPDRHIGLSYTGYGDFWWASAGLFGEKVEDEVDDGDESYAFTGRSAFFPVHQDGKLLHLGFSASRRKGDANGYQADGTLEPSQVEFEVKPESHVDRKEFLETGDISFVSHVNRFGIETAASYGPVSFQAEYARAYVQREQDLSTIQFDGGYAQATCFLTGENHTYWPSQAEFGRVKPLHDYGALELAVRYSTANLNDFNASITGGQAENVTVGLNWFATANFNLLLNYAYVNNDRYANGNGGIPLETDARGQPIGADFSYVQMRLLAYF